LTRGSVANFLNGGRFGYRRTQGFVTLSLPGREVPDVLGFSGETGCLGIKAAVHKHINNKAILIDGPPQPVLLAADGDDDLIVSHCVV
jgi:hypothetical protein